MISSQKQLTSYAEIDANKQYRIYTEQALENFEKLSDLLEILLLIYFK